MDHHYIEGNDKDKKKRVLVTGATGFIGSKVVNELSQYPTKYDVYVFARDSSNTQHLPKGVSIKRGSLLSKDSLYSVVKDMDVVIHLAAEMNFYPYGKSGIEWMHRVNVTGTKNLITALAHSYQKQKEEKKEKKEDGIYIDPPRFVYISSTEVFGDVKDVPADENTKKQPIYDYGKSKVSTERVVRTVSETTGIDYVILRPTGVMGIGDTFAIYELQHMINSGLLCFIPGSGDALLMFTHVDDIVQGIILGAFVKEASREDFILCPDNALSYEEWIQVLSRLTGRTKPFIHLPLFLVKLSTVLLMPFMNYGKKRIFMYHPNTIDRMAAHRCFSNSKAKKVLGFNPKYTIVDTLGETVTYNFSHGLLKRYYFNPILQTLVIRDNTINVM